jgi:uncharacterized protein YodC (DUF2158 family)
MDEIKVGDVVQLKSGGPDMTVEDVGDYTMTTGLTDGVKCTWFDGKKTATQVFGRQSLVKV